MKGVSSPVSADRIIGVSSVSMFQWNPLAPVRNPSFFRSCLYRYFGRPSIVTSRYMPRDKSTPVLVSQSVANKSVFGSCAARVLAKWRRRGLRR